MKQLHHNGRRKRFGTKLINRSDSRPFIVEFYDGPVEDFYRLIMSSSIEYTISVCKYEVTPPESSKGKYTLFQSYIFLASFVLWSFMSKLRVIV